MKCEYCSKNISWYHDTKKFLLFQDTGGKTEVKMHKKCADSKYNEVVNRLAKQGLDYINEQRTKPDGDRSARFTITQWLLMSSPGVDRDGYFHPFNYSLAGDVLAKMDEMKK